MTNGFIKAKHVAKSINRPLPKDLTMDDFLDENQYAALAEASRLRRMSQKQRKALCAATRLIKVSECCSKPCCHADDSSINSYNSPGIEMSLEDKAGSLEVMGIIDYPSDEAAAETSIETNANTIDGNCSENPIDTDSADKQFVDAMQVLSQITAEANEDDIESMAKYINGDTTECILVDEDGYEDLSDDGMPPEMDVSDDEDEDEPHLNVHGYLVDQRVKRPDADAESDTEEDPNAQELNSKNHSQDLLDLAQNSVDFMESLIDMWKGSEIHETISKELQEVINNSKSRLRETAATGSHHVEDSAILDMIADEHAKDESEHINEMIAPIVYQEREMVMTAEKVKKIRVAADSGAVDHIANPSDLPGDVQLIKNEEHRDFVNASGGGIKNHGEAKVKLKGKNGRLIGNTFQVAEVCRPLHSVGKICDGGHDMLFTKDKAVVVPEGALAKFLETCAHVLTYEREPNGLYVAEMEVSAIPKEDLPSFTRQGPGR